MQINVKLIGVFRIGRFKEQVGNYPPGKKVQDVVDELDLPKHILGIILINGVHARLSDQLNDGDELTLLPVLDGG